MQINSLLRSTKTVFRAAFVTVLISLTFQTRVYGLVSWTPLSALKYRTSIHSLIVSTQPSYVRSAVSTSCQNSIRQVFEMGGDFRSRELLKMTRTLQESNSEETRDGEFFHYTNSQVVLNIVREKRVEDLFSYMRVAGQRVSGEQYFYVAEDKASSAQFGQYRVILRLPPDALIYFSSGLDISRSELDNARPQRNLQRLIDQELIRKYPELSPCEDSILGPVANKGYTHYHSVLTSLAIEAEGISLIAYFGNIVGSNWYQVAGPWVVEKDELRFP